MNIPDEAVEAARAEVIGYVGECICDVAYTSRKLLDPQCCFHLIDGIGEDIVKAALPAIERAVVSRISELAIRDDHPDAVAALRWIQSDPAFRLHN